MSVRHRHCLFWKSICIGANIVSVSMPACVCQGVTAAYLYLSLPVSTGALGLGQTVCYCQRIHACSFTFISVLHSDVVFCSCSSVFRNLYAPLYGARPVTVHYSHSVICPTVTASIHLSVHLSRGVSTACVRYSTELTKLQVAG